MSVNGGQRVAAEELLVQPLLTAAAAVAPGGFQRPAMLVLDAAPALL